MIMDYNAQFSDAQDLVATSLTFPATYDLDTEVANSDTGAGTPIWVVCRVGTACAGLATLAISVRDSDDATTWFNRYTTIAYSLGECDAAGATLLAMPLPAQHKRYLRLLYAITTSATAGTLDAFLTFGPPRVASFST